MSESEPPHRPLSLGDYERLAQQHLEPEVWDFIHGGAGDERTVRANTEAFDRVRLLPRLLTGSMDPDMAATVLGRRWAAPIGVAPMAYHTLAHPDGEIATVRAAAAAGLPTVVSTFAGRTFEELAGAAAGAPLWLQIYCFRDRATTQGLVERAERAGFEALVLTADVPRLGRRIRDLRNGFRLPPGIAPANLSGADFSSPEAHARTELDPGLDWSVLAWLRSISPLPILVKGIMTARDALRALDAGAAGIVVSNHGGRQLDGVPAAFEVLPAIAAAVAGQGAVLLDGGIRRGTDVLAAVASGADAVLVGRPVLHGLAAGGQDGVSGVLGVLGDELCDAMALIGAGSLAELTGDLLAPAPQVAAAAGRTAELEDARPRHPYDVAATMTDPAGALRKELLHSSLADPLLETMSFLNEITARYPDAVSFAPGRPYEGFFEIEDVFTHMRRYLDHLAKQGATPAEVRTFLFQYGATAGHIRQVVADALREDEGIDIPAESVVITAGCQEAMLISLRALLAGPDDVLLVSAPAYVGITGAARLLEVTVATVEEDEQVGLTCAAVEAAVRRELARGRRPRALYVVPDHSNPSGNTIGLDVRHGLLDLAARWDFLLLEDSPYRGVSPGERLPTLKALDRERRVVLLGSYAKTAFPGARVGFAVADQPVRDASGRTGLLADELAKIKSMVTVNTSPLGQAAVAGMLLAPGGGLSPANEKAAQHYGDCLETLLDALEHWFPAERREIHGVRWNTPTGGFFITLHLPFAGDEQALARSAQEFGVIWTPMSYFHPNGGGGNAIRLSFSSLPPADIETGISRLASFIRSESARNPARHLGSPSAS